MTQIRDTQRLLEKEIDKYKKAFKTLDPTIGEEEIDRLSRGLRPGTAGWIMDKLQTKRAKVD